MNLQQVKLRQKELEADAEKAEERLKGAGNRDRENEKLEERDEIPAEVLQGFKELIQQQQQEITMLNARLTADHKNEE